MAGSSYSYDKSTPFFSTEDAATSGGKEEIETRTLESSFRSLSLLHESEQIGNATAEELTRQREQLQNTEHKLDQINSSLRTSQKHIQGIKSVFGSIRNYFSSSTKPETTAIKTSASTSELDKQATPRSKLADILETSAEHPEIQSIQRNDFAQKSSRKARMWMTYWIAIWT
ncbi:Synaptosomal-associated protein 29 [Orchesella cincta]|uniref:Synaptosomal-associated protein 29 n=1 Tax=Orchesella cincta TaxID=48709 RepID=A0A1D2MG78_ORCCI|nr:Synaptosomal-associated protein 29 [Orchesella cincta]